MIAPTLPPSDIPLFPITIAASRLLPDACRLLALAFPLLPADTSLVQLTNGITNSLVLCVAPSLKLLIRVYGINSHVLIDRKQELLNLRVLANLLLAPQLYCRFNNGLVYGFVEGKVISVKQMGDVHIASLIAKTMATWHKVKLPKEEHLASEPSLKVLLHKDLRLASLVTETNSSPYKNPAPQLFPTLAKWIAASIPHLTAVPSSFTCPKKQERFLTSKISIAALEQELSDIKTIIEALNAPVVFCHNDLLSGNIIYHKETGILSLNKTLLYL